MFFEPPRCVWLEPDVFVKHPAPIVQVGTCVVTVWVEDHNH